MPEIKEEATIRVAELRDAHAVVTIYNHYVETSIITFEEQAVTVAEIERRIEEVQAASLPWLIAEAGGQVAGYAYATPWRPRSAYRFSVEITAYLAAGTFRRGIGSLLYTHLFAKLRAAGIHSVIAGIALPNPASVALHEKFGLRKVAHFEEVGFKFHRWIDVGYWQRAW
jgi:phosphinothricin acetyltransferase